MSILYSLHNVLQLFSSFFSFPFFLDLMNKAAYIIYTHHRISRIGEIRWILHKDTTSNAISKRGINKFILKLI